jgi:serine phosphatase RsbU (regulator of sigma subunit)
VIGDVSGRGLEAGITMASLRFAIRAYAAEDPSPHGILEKLSRLIDVSDDGAFATVLCAVFDGGERTITVANAGHPAPLLVNGAGARFLDTAVGLPIGIARSTYEERVEPAGDHGTLLAFTDGLYERRDESIEHGLERVRAAGIGDGGSLDAVLDRVIGHVAGPQRDDDLAVLAVRWRR